MTQAPLHWIQKIEQTLIDTGAIPLSGYSPAFPWDSLREKVASLLQAPSLTLSLKRMRLLKGEEITEGLGTHVIPLTLQLSPLSGSAYFLMGKEEMSTLTAYALTSSNKGFLSLPFQEGFYYYLCTEALILLNGAKAFGDLTLKMGKTTPIPQEESLCLDIEIAHPKQSFFARVVCPASFHEAFKTHFSEKKGTASSCALHAQIETLLHFSIGETLLSLQEWKQVCVGDFILLDRCTFDPHTKKGTVTIALDSTPLWRARLKEDHLKIVDYATYYEDVTPMDSELPPSDEESPKEATFSSEEMQEENGETHLWSSTPKEVVSISTDHIPLTLIVEVARVHMTLGQVLQLSPGNTLELPVKPEQGVDVMIGGKRVAKAELIKLGDRLGIKIISLGE
jgi:flagellar motor switch protein FliN/FliY